MATPGELRHKLEGYGLEPVSLSAHSDLTTAEWLEHGIKAVRWADENENRFPREHRRDGGRGGEGGYRDRPRDPRRHHGLGRCHAPATREDRPRLIGINYDTANVIFYSGDTPVEDLPRVVDKLVHVHLKESKGGKGVWDFGEIGGGEVDFRGVLQILGDAGYDGPYSVEIEFSGEPWPPLADVNAAMRRSREYLNGLGVS